MALIEWRKEFCTGISGVDFEHECLINKVNEIYAMIDNNADKENVIDKLGDIYGSISAHFALEEQMMKKHCYDHYEEHHTDHERLLDDIQDITEEFESTDFASASDLDTDKFKQKLNDWFQIHFATHDARLHGFAHLTDHTPVCESTMKTMIQNAKNVLLRRAD